MSTCNFLPTLLSLSDAMVVSGDQNWSPSFHYLDDILLLRRERALLRVVTRGLCELVQAQSLLMSIKSQTEPSALLTWIGKTFDLARGTVRNTLGMVRKVLAVVVRAAVSNLMPKRVERVTGGLQWLFGPRRGMTAFMFGWYSGSLRASGLLTDPHA